MPSWSASSQPRASSSSQPGALAPQAQDTANASASHGRPGASQPRDLRMLSPRGRASPHSRSKSHNINPATSYGAPPALFRPEVDFRHTLTLRRSEGDLLAAAERDGADTKLPYQRRVTGSNMDSGREAPELAIGQCICCNSTVRWPSHLAHFRCTVCMTINDLRPLVRPATSQTPTPLSVQKTKELFDASVREFLTTLRSMTLPEPLNPTPGAAHEASLGTLDEKLAQDDDPLLPPSRPPPPPPAVDKLHGKSHAGESRSGLDAGRPSIYHAMATSLFRPVEDYIHAAFSSSECLNASFLEISEGPEFSDPGSSKCIERDSGHLKIPPTGEPGEKETIMLTIGRVVKERAGPSISCNVRKRERGPSTRALPGIDWIAVREFYDLLLDPRNESIPWWEIESRRLEADGSLIDRDVQLHNIALIHRAVCDARTEMLNVLLAATENLLKRPRKLLKQPDDTRFLAIILANPLLVVTSLGWDAPGKSEGSKSRLEGQEFSTSRTTPRKSALASGPNNNTGILKRLFGLMSNLTNECHHYLISWFSVMPQSLFRDAVDLGSSFTTHRLNRLDGRSAGSRGVLFYSDDWQIKAVARVTSLLEKANENSLGRRKHSQTPIGEMGSTGQALQRDAARRGQLVSSSAFYNSRLDYCDVLADFDAWESKRARFCFCQYPFYLSMGAKIQILEYDARRQMELRARQAFLNSISNRTVLSQYMILKVRRECLVEDSLKGISESAGTMEDIKKGLRVEFVGEDGIDAGGLKKEWFLMVARDVFDPNHGLFVYDEDSSYCYFNPYSFESSEEFFLVGVLLGLAIYNSTILDVALPPYVFRRLIYHAPNYGKKTSIDQRNRPPFRRTLEDLALIRPGLARGLQQLLDFEGNVEEAFYQDFVAETNRYGEPTSVALCEGGENRPVTNVNRGEFVDLYVRYILDTSVSRQFEPFKRGFYMVCGGNALSLFGPEEIELLVRGSAEPLDVQALKAVATYEGWGPSAPPEADVVVKWFWGFFERISPEEQRMLLSFITGSDRIPAMGATNLTIKLMCLGKDCDRFPIARTCFNQIGIWRYKRRDKLERMLWRAVTESEGFGLK